MEEQSTAPAKSDSKKRPAWEAFTGFAKEMLSVWKSPERGLYIHKVIASQSPLNNQ